MAEDGNNVVVEKPVEIEPQPTNENTVDTSIETALKPKESGIKRRIKINIPGIITTNSSSRKPPSNSHTHRLIRLNVMPFTMI
jgi:hypothetical protein